MAPLGTAPLPSAVKVLAARVKAALWGMYIGDALAMPVHWYYDRARIFRDFPPRGITRYEAPVDSFPGSIMSLSSTGGGGRGGDDGTLIGDVLVKGKRHLWARGGPGYHYHHGMPPAAPQGDLSRRSGHAVGARCGAQMAEGHAKATARALGCGLRAAPESRAPEATPAQGRSCVQPMRPGDNTLDTLVARLMLQTLAGKGRKLGEAAGGGAGDPSAGPLAVPAWLAQAEADFASLGSLRRDLRRLRALPAAGGAEGGAARRTPFTAAFLAAYIRFMTTRDSHPDVYVATAHRMFFANFVGGEGGEPTRDPFGCADNDGHNTDSVDGLINVGVVSLNQLLVEAAEVQRGSSQGQRGSSHAAAEDAALVGPLLHDCVNVVRRSSVLPEVGLQYHRLLRKLVLDGTPLRPAIEELVDEFSGALPLTRQKLESFAASRGDHGASDPMSACYVGSNWPVTLLLAYKYNSSLEEALLAGANAGGENTNRNALLGTILGAALGGSPEGWREVEKWREGLRAVDELEGEIDTFVEEVLHSSPGATPDGGGSGEL